MKLFKMKNISILFVTSISVFGVLESGCGTSTSSTSDGTTSITAASNMSGAANAPSGTVFNDPKFNKKTYASKIYDFFVNSAWATTCGSVITGTYCSGSTLTATLGGCSFLNSLATATGSMIFTWTTGSCASPPSSSAASAVFTRTAGDNGSGGGSPIVITGVSGNSVTITTQDTSGFSVSKTGGTTVTCGSSGTCATGRSTTINGVHWVGNYFGSSFDHTISTSSPLTMTGTGSSLQISGGTTLVQHNLAKFTATSAITSTLTFSSGCCVPTGGSISTTFSGGSLDSKTESLAFSSTCGSATLTNSTGKTSTVTLPFCI